MGEIPEVFAIFEQKLAHVLSFTLREKGLKKAIEELLVYFSGVVERASKAESRIAELDEFKMIVEGCGFEVITEPPVLNHPERKILKGHGTIYVPELPEPPEVRNV